MLFTYLSTGIWVLAMSLTLIGTWLALRHFSQSPPYLDAPFGLFPVSILKPLKGIDEGLEENLESFFMIDYPVFELIFSVANPNDPAIVLIKKLARKHPRVRARLIVGEVQAGVNPKVNNLIQSYEGANYDWILISDSNVRVKPDYLKRLMAHVGADTGVVTAIVAGRLPSGVGGALEAIYLNTFYVRAMHLAALVGRPCVIGKSMLFRASVAERFGGIKTLARYLHEDYMTGEAMRKLGLKVLMMRDPIDQHIGRYSFEEFWSRHIRWGRIRKFQAPLPFILEPFLGCVVSGVIGAIGFRAFGIPVDVFLVAHLATWSLCDLLIMTRMRVKPSTKIPLGWFVRELLAFPLWIHIAAGNTVNWRGQKLTLQPGCTLEKVVL